MAAGVPSHIESHEALEEFPRHRNIRIPPLKLPEIPRILISIMKRSLYTSYDGPPREDERLSSHSVARILSAIAGLVLILWGLAFDTSTSLPDAAASEAPEETTVSRLERKYTLLICGWGLLLLAAPFRRGQL